MKPKTKKRIELIFLLIIAIGGYIWACTLESSYEREMRVKEANTFRSVYMDGQQVLIPVD